MFTIYCEGWEIEIKPFPELTSGSIYAIFSDSSGEIWEGSALQIAHVVTEAMACSNEALVLPFPFIVGGSY